MLPSVFNVFSYILVVLSRLVFWISYTLSRVDLKKLSEFISLLLCFVLWLHLLLIPRGQHYHGCLDSANTSPALSATDKTKRYYPALSPYTEIGFINPMVACLWNTFVFMVVPVYSNVNLCHVCSSKLQGESERIYERFSGKLQLWQSSWLWFRLYLKLNVLLIICKTIGLIFTSAVQ